MQGEEEKLRYKVLSWFILKLGLCPAKNLTIFSTFHLSLISFNYNKKRLYIYLVTIYGPKPKVLLKYKPKL